MAEDPLPVVFYEPKGAIGRDPDFDFFGSLSGASNFPVCIGASTEFEAGALRATLAARGIRDDVCRVVLVGERAEGPARAVDVTNFPRSQMIYEITAPPKLPPVLFDSQSLIGGRRQKLPRAERARRNRQKRDAKASRRRNR